MAHYAIQQDVRDTASSSRTYTRRDDRSESHNRLFRDYFAEEPKFNETFFRQRFRISRRLFVKIASDLENNFSYFQRKIDARGKWGFSALQRCTSVVRQLGYGSNPDSLDDYLNMSERSSRDTLNAFCDGVIKLYRHEYLRRPTRTDTQRILDHHARNISIIQTRNGFHFSPEFLTSGEFFPTSDRLPPPLDRFPPPFDVDRSLCDLFSGLNLSSAISGHVSGHMIDPPPLLRRTLAASSSVHDFSDMGFGFPGNDFSDVGFGFPANGSPVMYSGDVFPASHSLLCDDTESFRRNSFSRNVDYFLDFDQKSTLCSKKYLYKNLSENRNLVTRNEIENGNLGIWSLRNLRGRIYTLAKDQNGCRILQTLFERPTIEDVQVVFNEVVDCVSDLMNDLFGNYLVQKLVSVCNEDQKMQLIFSLMQVPNNIILVCMSPHGTRAMQRLLENLKDPNQIQLVIKALQRGVTTLAKDPNGHHVIQYCLVHFDSEYNKPILFEIANDCYAIATDRSGCCVLQACVEHSRGDLRTRIVTKIMLNSVNLAEDPFGNYVLQHMVGLNIPALTSLLVRHLQGNFAALSRNKYASNVVEKCLTESREDVSNRIVLELLTSPDSSLLLTDQYANFVIQSALKISRGPAYNCLRNLISENVASMRTNLYGKKILERFEKKKVNLIKN
uniref:pumilio homolog 12-like n=1 Tax=Erigeron canadensis TaxID=72917 RepID=UPI001CB8942A|nr:pumilio homolog 12-like [Erigeron canadensis]